LLPNSHQLDKQTNRLTIVNPDGSRTVFDLLNDRASLLFFSELMYLDNLLTTLSSSSPLRTLAVDEYPDLFAISFASFTGLVTNFGTDSSEVRAASHILDSAIPKVIDGLSSLYGNRLVTELLLLERIHQSSSQSQVEQETQRVILSKLNRILPHQQHDVNEYYPSLYLPSNTLKMSKICDSLSNEIHQSNPDIDVYCPLAGGPNTNVFFQLQAVSSGATNTTTSSNTVVHYQITLWLVIVLILLGLFTIYAMAFMTFKKDTLLYSPFNPTWEESRKKR